MSFNQISNINLFSKDNKELINFYKSIGMSSLGEDQPKSWHGFGTQGVVFAIEPISNREKVAQKLDIIREDQVLIQFKAKDMNELSEMTSKLRSIGAKILWDKKKVSYGTVTNFLDPDGNMMEILLEEI